MKRLIMFIMIITLLLLAGCFGEIEDRSAEPSPQSTQTEYIEQNAEITQADIEEGKALVEKYFEARQQKDAEKIIECYHPDKMTKEQYDAGGVVLFEHEEITLVKIHEYDPEFAMAFDQRVVDMFGAQNVMVFKVDYEVTFPNGGGDNSAYDEGTYTDWAVVLVRDGAGSPWLIYGQGY